MLTLFQCLYGLRVHTAWINICMHVKNPKCWQPCFSPRVNFQWRLTYSLCTAPQCKLHASTLKSQTLDLWGGQKGYVLSGAHQQTLHKFIKTKSSLLSYNLSPSVALTLSFSVCLFLEFEFSLSPSFIITVVVNVVTIVLCVAYRHVD